MWKQPEDAVADADPRHALAGREDRADELVADGEAGLDPDAAMVDVEIRAADPGRLDLHDRVVAGLGLGLGAVLDADIAGGLEGDGTHGASRVWGCGRFTGGPAVRTPEPLRDGCSRWSPYYSAESPLRWAAEAA